MNGLVEHATGGAPQAKAAGGEDQAVAPVADNGDGGSGMRGLRDATTVEEFVPTLLALLPPVVMGLLTTFNSSEGEHGHGHGLGHEHTSKEKCRDGKLQEEEKHDDSKYQDGVVLQALQGTEVYQEVTRMERCGRSSSATSADGIVTDANGGGGGGGNGGDGAKGPNGGAAKGADSCGAKGPDTCDASCGAVDGLAPPSPQQGAAAVVAPFPSSVPVSPSPTSLSSYWAEEHSCGCSSRHVVTIMAYAFLLLLHKRDHEGGHGGGAGAGPGDGADDLPEPVWRKDPLQMLPTPVADEAKHVAGMLRGLVEMEKCEKCAQS